VPTGTYRNQKIEELDDRVKPDVVTMFEEFENVLGPVESAKALHLLAPEIFPLWDIGNCGEMPGVRSRDRNDTVTATGFMERARRQCLELRLEGATGSC